MGSSKADAVFVPLCIHFRAVPGTEQVLDESLLNETMPIRQAYTLIFN